MTTIRLGHSPDADDAFMFYALAMGKISTPLKYVHHLEDIETLNRKAEKGAYELTAVSFYGWTFVADRYALLPCGGSFGDGYGPIVAVRDEKQPERSPAAAQAWLRGKNVAIPGERTSARLCLRLFADDVPFRETPTPFDQILNHVAAGKCDAGVVIHEGQLTYADQSLALLADLGVWWKTKTGLPLPLGGNAVRRDLPQTIRRQIELDLRASVAWGWENRAETLAYAGRFGRGLTTGQADRFVKMYVNELTRDIGAAGRKALKLFLDAGRRKGLTPASFETFAKQTDYFE